MILISQSIRCFAWRALRCTGAAVAVALACGWQPAAAQSSLTVSAFVLSKTNCRFDTTSLILDFGTINSASTATAAATVPGRVRCTGGKDSKVSLSLSLGGGSHSSGGVRRMQHATIATEYLAYGLSISPATATIDKNSSLDFTVSGTVLASQYQNAMAGNYLDTVTITVSP